MRQSQIPTLSHTAILGGVKGPSKVQHKDWSTAFLACFWSHNVPQGFWGVCGGQGCIRRADNHRRRGVPSPLLPSYSSSQ